jgi:alpha-tubulin suppressor-like RCC1 family protein
VGIYIQLKALRRALFVAVLLLYLNSCSGGSTPPAPEAGALGAGQGGVKFLGASKVTPNRDGTWTVLWSPLTSNFKVDYRVFMRATSENSYSFEAPVYVTPNVSYITEDLRLIGSQCYVVRFSEGEVANDDNTNEVCTNHEPYAFDGISELTSLDDSSYLLSWESPSFDGALFQVYSSENEGEWQLLGSTAESYYKSAPLSLDRNVCFRVKYTIDGFPEDTNNKSICSSSALKNLTFSGISGVEASGPGKVRISWPMSEREDVVGYNIYIGSQFKELISKTQGRSVLYTEIDNLEHATVYTFGVRSRDEFGREDSNAKVISFELKNHKPLIKSVILQAVNLDVNGRPESLKCLVDYEDDDAWQTVKPKFVFKNKKRGGVELVDRTEVAGLAWAIESRHTLLDQDQRADHLVCRVSVHDGFEQSDIVESAPFVVPDTPVVAQNVNVQTYQNTEFTIAINRGEGLGYLDFDADDAIQIIVDDVSNGRLISPEFTCTSGSCTAKFKPALNFYTPNHITTPFDLTDPQNPIDNSSSFATLSFRVRAGDATSIVAKAFINVFGVPRALGFSMQADQDEERFASIGKMTETDVDDNVITFNAYSYVDPLANASHVLIKSPLYENAYFGKVRLPDGVVQNEAAGTYCRNLTNPGWTKVGFECRIPCVADKCPFVFLADEGYYGPAMLDYAVEVNGILSNYAAVELDILPKLRASGYLALTVQKRVSPFSVELSEGKGIQGSANGLTINSIDTRSISVGAASLNFSPVVGLPNTFSALVTGVPASFYGNLTFQYRINGFDPNTNQNIESNWGDGSIKYYPKPIAKAIYETTIENLGGGEISQLPIPYVPDLNGTNGYLHPYGTKAFEVAFQDLQNTRIYLDALGQATTSGTLSCNFATDGACTQDIIPYLNYFDQEPVINTAGTATTLYKMKYQVSIRIPDQEFNNPAVFIDPILINPASRILSSDSNALNGDGHIYVNVRPRPRLNGLQMYVKEFTAAEPTSINFSYRPTAPINYSHPLNGLVSQILVNSVISQGNLANAGCDIVGVCPFTFTPNLGVVGTIMPISITGFAFDTQYTKNNGMVPSAPALINIDVRPVPKIQLPQPRLIYMPENASFLMSPQNRDITISLNNGFSHASGLEAVSAIFNVIKFSDDQFHGLITAPSGSCTSGQNCVADCASEFGMCRINLTPEVDFQAYVDISYRVAVNDPFLGTISSVPGTMRVDLRPRPRVSDYGTLAARLRADENIERSLLFRLGNEYTHSDGALASQVQIVNGANGAQHHGASGYPTGSCASGNCTIRHKAEFNYEGDAYLEYRLVVDDPMLVLTGNNLLESNIGKGYLDVYPQPRATKRLLYIPQLATEPLTIQLAPKATLTNPLNEDDVDLEDRMGYAHRRDDAATLVEVQNPPSADRGELGSFGCTAATRTCTASYKAGVYVDEDTIDKFNYRVTVGGRTSEYAEYSVKVLPSAISDDMVVVTRENDAITVEFAQNAVEHEGLGYFHPTGAKATRIELVASSHIGGTPLVTDLDLGSTNNCDVNGSCRVVFTPTSDTFSPKIFADNQDLFKFSYIIYTFEPNLGIEVPSLPATVRVNVRQIPRTESLSTARVQGSTDNFQLSRGAGLGYTYTFGFAASAEISGAAPDIAHMQVISGTALCEQVNGHCTFTSSQIVPEQTTPGVYYYGQVAKFKYRVVVDDAYIAGGKISSNWSTFSIDYRPKPVATGLVRRMWQSTSRLIEMAYAPSGQAAGYFHPYYSGDNAAYRPTNVVLPTPSPDYTIMSGVDAGFICDPGSYKCTGNITPTASYFTTGPNLVVPYKVVVNDPVIGPIESDLGAFEVYVGKVPQTSNRNVKGVESVDKVVVFDGANNLGFSYDGSFAVSAQVNPATITNGSFVDVVNPIVCSGLLCNGSFKPNAGFYGAASFSFRIVVTSDDPSTLPNYVSPYRSYGIDFYPRPVALDLLKAQGKHYLGNEATESPIVIDLGTNGTNFCANQSETKLGYIHPLCEPAAKVKILSVDNGIFTTGAGDNSFSCNAFGVCSASFLPNAPNGGWLGYGLTSIGYQIVIDPDALDGQNLSAAEIAALTSQAKTLEIDVAPRIWASGMRIAGTDYTYAVENESVQLEIKRCDDTLKINCNLGYVHGYNFSAEEAQVTFPTPKNVNYTLSYCSSGICPGVLSPVGAYYSSNPLDYASFDYRVRNGSQWSNYEPVNVVVVPKPRATAMTSYGLENEVQVITIAMNNGYTHPWNVESELVNVVTPLDPAKGKFTDNLGFDLALGTPEFTCVTGTCTAYYKPTPNIGGVNTFYFRVKALAPANMPVSVASKLFSGTQSFEIHTIPKPDATNMEVVLIEGSPKPFSVFLDNGFTHDYPIPGVLNKVIYQSEMSGGKLKANITSHLGNILQTNPVFACTTNPLECVRAGCNGNCAFVFEPLNNSIFSNTIAEANGCQSVGANCPEIPFKVSVDTVGNLEATSADAAKIFYNVRPKPKIAVLPAEFMAAQGDPIVVTLKNGRGVPQNLGYDYPFAEPGASTLDIVTHDASKGGFAAQFQCTDVPGDAGICTATYNPNPAFTPSAATKYATFTYKVKVNDRTFTNQPINTTRVGLIESNVGSGRIEYRPRPSSLDTNRWAIENEASRNLTIGLGSGYSYEYSTDRQASKVRILGGQRSNLSVLNAGCKDPLIDCIIACVSGSCSISVKPDLNFYGQASLKFKVAVTDEAFTVATDLYSLNTGTLNVDVRARPDVFAIARTGIENQNLLVTLERGSAKDYNYLDTITNLVASKLNIHSISNASVLDGQFDCFPTSGHPNYSKCIGTVVPTPQHFGAAVIEYSVEVVDPIAGTIESARANLTVDFRPVPDATGKPAAIAVLKGSTRDVALNLGANDTDPTGYYYPYSVHPSLIPLVQPDAAFASVSLLQCSTSGSPGSCDLRINSSAATSFGSSSFSYQVGVVDAVLGQAMLSNSKTIAIDVRPNIVAFDLSHTTNNLLKCIENSDLNITIQRGATLGYDYPNEVAYTSVINTLSMSVKDKNDGVSGSNGDVLPGHNCNLGVCSLIFRPDPTVIDSALFNYKLSVTDASLLAGAQLIETQEKVVNIDLYPRPRNNNILSYTLMNTPVPFALSRGAGLGYTHGRNHSATKVYVDSVANGSAMTSASFACTSGNCSATFSPANGHFTTEANIGNPNAYANLYVEVTEPGTGGRVATSPSGDIGRASFVVYPKLSVSDAAVTAWSWEGEASSITILKGAGVGYEHPWASHSAGLADQIKVLNPDKITPNGGLGGGVYACNGTGQCAVTFMPTVAQVAGGFDYQVRSTYAPLSIGGFAPEQWSLGTGHANISIQPKAVVAASPKLVKVVENEPIALGSLSISQGDGYTYSGNVSQIAKARFSVPTYLSCTPSQCSNLELSCSSGVCGLPAITLANDFHRAQGLGNAKVKYEIQTDASANGLGVRWSGLQNFELEVLPKAKATGISVANGIESVTKAVSITTAPSVAVLNGYFHPESAVATQVRINSVVNMTLASGSLGSPVNCTTGTCNVSFNPQATAFSDVAGKPENGGKTYGWASFTYQVKVPVDGVDIWSTEGTGYIYFRQVPKPQTISNVATNYGVQNDAYIIELAINNGYTFDAFGSGGGTAVNATGVSVVGLPANLTINSSSCDQAQGKCTINMTSTGAATATKSMGLLFTVNSVQQIQESTLQIKFVDRPNVVPISGLSVNEGDTLVIDFDKGVDYTQSDSNSASSLIYESFAGGGSIRYQNDASAWASCTSIGGGKFQCPCKSSGLCTLDLTPSAWNDGTASVNGEGVRATSFSYKVLDGVFKERSSNYVDSLVSENTALVSITMNPRLVANTKSVVAGAFQGLEGTGCGSAVCWKDVEITQGAGGVSPGGYIHNVSGEAKRIQIRSLTNLEIDGCGGADCMLNCAAGGSCTVKTKSLTGGTFAENASFVYDIYDHASNANYKTHNRGQGSVYFYPQPKGTTIEKVDAIESQSYSTSVSLGTGFTHVKSQPATGLQIVSVTNVQNYAANDLVTCTAGVCALSVQPKAGTFDAVAGKIEPNGNAFGWAKVEYRIKVTNSGLDVWSTPGTLLVYFRPIPKPVDFSLNTTSPPTYGIEGQIKKVYVGLHGTTSGSFSLKGYTHALSGAPESILVYDIGAGGELVGTDCSSGAYCVVDFRSASPGIRTFKFKVTVNSVQQVTPTAVSVTFVERLDTQALGPISLLEGSTHDFVLSNASGYSLNIADASRKAADVLVRGITGGSIQAVVAGTPQVCNAVVVDSISYSRCLCEASGTCRVRFSPDAWPANTDDRTGGFSYRVRDALYLEQGPNDTYANALVSSNESSATINLQPRVYATAKSYPEGATQAVESSDKSISLTLETPPATNGGYRHNVLGGKADSITIKSPSGISVTGCGAYPCVVACSNGNCDLTVTRTSDGTGTFSYMITDLDGYVSHKDGAASVYFFPRPKTLVAQTIRVAKNSVDNVLPIGLNSGYTINKASVFANNWAAQSTASLNGTFNNWSCTGSGACSVKYTPTAGYSSSTATAAAFTYSVTVPSASGDVSSLTPYANYSIDVFPLPAASSQTLRWVQGWGDRNVVTQADAQKIVINLGDEVTQVGNRTEQVTEIQVQSVSGGAFVGTPEFSCTAGVCTGKFVPLVNTVSPNNATAAASFQYRVVMGGFVDFPSAWATYSIIIMPKVTSVAVDIETDMKTTPKPVKFANTTDLPANKFQAFTHTWGLGLFENTHILITEQPTAMGAFDTSNINCVDGYCQANLIPDTENKSFSGDVPFKYRVKIQDPGYPELWDLSAEQTGMISVKSIYVATGVYKYEKNFDPLAIPKTTMNVTIRAGASLGYTVRSGNSNPLDIEFKKDGNWISSAGLLAANFSQGDFTSSQWDSGTGIWTGTFVTNDFYKGWLKLPYRVCFSDCTQPNNFKSLSEASELKWLRMEFDLSDAPPIGCSKNLVAYKNINRTFALAKGASCGNGIWYTDANTSDLLKSFTIKTEPNPAHGALLQGPGTTCVGSAPNRVCTCDVLGECSLIFDPATDAIDSNVTFTFNPRTKSELLSSGGTDFFTSATNDTSVTIDLRQPLAPEATSLNASTNEDVQLFIDIMPGSGYKTVTQMNASYDVAPDGHEVLATSIENIAFDSALINSATLIGCDIYGVCEVRVVPKRDVSGATAIQYKVRANGVLSATSGSINLTITNIDDLPNTLAEIDSSYRFNRRMRFSPTHIYAKNDGVFSVVGAPDTQTIDLQPYVGDPMTNGVQQGSLTNEAYGYFDIEGNKAVRVIIQNLSGGTLKKVSNGQTPVSTDAMECDVDGKCLVDYTPNGTVLDGYAGFDYKIVTVVGGVDRIQPEWSTFRIWIDDGNTEATNYHRPSQYTENPDINSVDWSQDEIWKAFRVRRADSRNLTLSYGPGNAYVKSRWLDYPGTEFATNVEIGNGSNGAAAPIGLTVDMGALSCSSVSGSCLVKVTADSTFPDYPAVASFWYRLKFGEGYQHNGYNYSPHLDKYSSWKKVTTQVVLNFDGVGCEDAPLGGLISVHGYGGGNEGNMSVPQGRITTKTFGAGAVAGNHYDHSGTGSTWRPLQSMSPVSASSGATVENISCLNGICNFDIKPAGANTPTNFADDDTGEVEVIANMTDDQGCTAQYQMRFDVVPLVVSHDRCKLDYSTANTGNCRHTDVEAAAPGTAQEIVYRPIGANPISNWNSFEYRTWDPGQLASKIEVFGFSPAAGNLLANANVPFSGPGVTCSGSGAGVVCSFTNCNIDTGDAIMDGQCSAQLNTQGLVDPDRYGLLAFKYRVYLANNSFSKAARRRDWNQGCSEAACEGHSLYRQGDQIHHIYVKAYPVITNPTYNVHMNRPSTITVGPENVSATYKGYIYKDLANLYARSFSMSVSNIIDLTVQSLNFDQEAKIGRVTILPGENIVGNRTLNYTTSVWGVDSTLGTATLNIQQFIQAGNITVGTNQSTPVVINLSEEIPHSNLSRLSGYNQEIHDVEVMGLSPLQGTTSAAGCTTTAGKASCQITFTPAAGFHGTLNLKVKAIGRYLEGADLIDIYSNNANLTINVIQNDETPVAGTVNLIGVEGEDKLVLLTKAMTLGEVDSYGYFDPNQDKAVAVEIQGSPIGGTVVPASPIACDANGNCLFNFRPSTDFYGMASLSYRVKTKHVATGNETWSNSATLSVNFKAKLLAQNLSIQAVKNVDKVINVTRGNGYLYTPGPEVDLLTVVSVTNGSVLETSPIACTAGACNLTFRPNTGFSGNASVSFNVTVDGPGSDDLTSTNAGIITITINDSDQAPVASDRWIEVLHRNVQTINMQPNESYSDRENDLATAVTVVPGSAHGGVAAALTCNVGVCQIQFDPDDLSQGVGEFSYTVTANGKVSNVAKVRYLVPKYEGPLEFQWDGLPSLSVNSNGTCNINSYIRVTSGTPNSYSGSFSAQVTGGTVVANADGTSGQLSSYSVGTPFLVSWTAGDGSNTLTQRGLVHLTSVSTSELALPVVQSVASNYDSMSGTQPKFAGCQGVSCNSATGASISVGSGFACSLNADLSASCWGDNSVGSLGAAIAPSVIPEMYPVAVKDPDNTESAIYGIKSLSAGSKHACALLNNRRVLCWGDNSHGQLGDPNVLGTALEYPAYVYKDEPGTQLLTNIVAISAGAQHTCAIDTAGLAWCWGKNTNGQLGDGSKVSKDYAVRVQKVTAKTPSVATENFSGLVMVAAGKNHSCAIYGTSGALVCWGANDKSQIADGNFSDDADNLSRLSGVNASGDRVYPVAVRDAQLAAVLGASRVSAGEDFSCILNKFGDVACFGDNEYHQSQGSNAGASEVVPHPVWRLGSQAVAISAGKDHVCYQTSNMGVECFGDNSEGQLGQTVTYLQTKSAVGVKVAQSSQSGSPLLANIVAIASGARNTCGISRSGGLTCWGRNTSQVLTTSDENIKGPRIIESEEGASFSGKARDCTTTYGASRVTYSNQVGVLSLDARLKQSVYTKDHQVQIKATFSKAVNVDPSLYLNLETGDLDDKAYYVSGSGTNEIVLAYTVQAGASAPNLQYVNTNSLALLSGNVTGLAGESVDLILPSLAARASLGSAGKAASIDAIVPGLPGNFTATSLDSTSIDLSWDAGSAATADIIIVQRQGAAVSWTPANGAIYAQGMLDANHKIVYIGRVQDAGYTAASLSPATTYHYQVFTRSSQGLYANGDQIQEQTEP